MIRHYFLISFRNIFRQKVFSFINIIGLSISLAICLLVIKMIFAIYSSDRFHQYKRQIYRVTTEVRKAHFDEYELATSPAPLKEELLQYSEIEGITRIWNRFSDIAISSDKPLQASGYFADPAFLEIFSFDLEYGNKDIALNEPYSVVLTREWAEKYFGNTNPIGKIIEFKEFGSYTVTGMFESRYAKKSHMKFDLIASGETLQLKTADYSENEKKQEKSPYSFANVLTSWDNVYRTYTYIKLKKGIDRQSLNGYFSEIINKHYDNQETKYTFDLQPLTKISPGRNLSNALGHVDDPKLTYILLFIAFIITITAGFTYTNLSIAKSLSRAKEVGIRKVIGAKRSQLILQFIVEALLLSLISLNLAYILLFFIEPNFYNLNAYMKQSFYIEEPGIWLYFTTLLFTLLLAIIIGYWPSKYMSRVSPSIALKDLFKKGTDTKINLKNIIILFQISVSLILIYTITIMYKQFIYQQNVDLGFNPEYIITLDVKGNDFEILHTELDKHASIKSISAVDHIPSVGIRSMVWVRGQDRYDSAICSKIEISPTFLETLEIKLIAGNGFMTSDISKNRRFTVISKSALPLLGYKYPNDAIGNTLIINGDKELTIVGVSTDIVVQGAERGPEAVIFRVSSENLGHVLIKYNSEMDATELISAIGITWGKIDPYHEFKYDFYTQKIEEYYASSKDMLKIFGAIAFFAVLISFLGLFGIVMYSVESRVKEVGIRRVFGAKISQVIWTLSRRFMIMIFIAILISTPLVWFSGNLILQNFYYRITISFQHFLFGMFCMVGLGLVSILTQTFNASYKNPVETLRYE